jgi:hypothetical protein
MHNVEWKIEGDKLIVTMDISQQSVDDAPPSASGKTHLVASTGSAMPVPSKHAKSMMVGARTTKRRHADSLFGAHPAGGSSYR